MGSGHHAKGPVGRRLREARLTKGLSQKQLGVKAGIDISSASARVNQYEKNRHIPDFGTAERLALVLGVPTSYLYTVDEELAEIIKIFASAPRQARLRTLDALRQAIRAADSPDPSE